MNHRLAALISASILALGSCAPAPAPEARTPRAERELAAALAGRTAGAPVRCLPQFRADNMQVIDDNTILFEDGRTIYVQSPPGGCPGIGSGRNTLVTKLWGTNQLCEGDISQLVDLHTGIGGGACVFGPFIPYTRPAG